MSQILRNCTARAIALANVTPAMRPQQRSIMNSLRRNKDAVTEKVVTPPAARPSPLNEGASLRTYYRPNRFEQRMLVWTKKYKSLNEVPSHVSPETMEYCRNKMRIRVANYMAIGTVIACIAMIYSGKQAAKRGEGMAKKNLDWHNQYNSVDTVVEEKK